jgi:hypothetical protein
LSRLPPIRRRRDNLRVVFFRSGRKRDTTQTAIWGDRTNAPYKPYVGGVPVSITGTPVLKSGSAGGYTASVSSGGLYFGGGNGAPNGATYTCNLSAGGAVDILVSVMTNAQSVANTTAMSTAITAMRTASQSTDWTLILRGGDYGTGAGAQLSILGQTFSGVVTDPNDGLDIDDRDLDAVAEYSGGSVRVLSEVRHAASFIDRVECLGSGPFIWDGVDFASEATVDGSNYPGDPSPDKTQSHVLYQLVNGVNVTYPTVKTALVRNCRFGGTARGTSSARWIQSVSLGTGFSVVEDCEFDGFTIGSFAIVMRRNTYRRQVTDAMRYGFGAGAHPDVYIYKNVFFDESADFIWSNEHTDGLQVGSTTTDQPVYFEFHNNILHYRGGSHGVYMDDTAATVSGIIQNNLFITNQVHGINGWRCGGTRGMVIKDNTVIEYPDGDAASSPPQINAGDNSLGPVALVNNITHTISAASANVGSLNNSTVLQTGDAYSAAFNGPFTGGSGAPVAPIDQTNATTLKSVLESLFSTKAGGPVAGKGWQASSTVLPVGLRYPRRENLAFSTLEMTSILPILFGPTGMTVTPGASTECQTSSASDGTGVLTAWTSSPFTANPGDYMRMRAATSASGTTETTLSATVNGQSVSAVFKTALAVPAAFLTSDATTAGYFVDPSNVPASTSRIAFFADLYFPTQPADNASIFAQESTGCDLMFNGTGGELDIRIEDGSAGNPALATGALTDVDGLTPNLTTGVWYRLEFDVNWATNLASLTVNGHVYTAPFSVASIGGFAQTGREVSIGARSDGSTRLPVSTRMANLSVNFNGSLHKAISNTVATANADSWKKPTSPTGDFT